MQRLILAVLVAMLSACATGPVSLPVANLSTSAHAPVADVRPKEEALREIFSLLITSDMYGYARLAQDLTEPTGPRLFAHRLSEKYGNGQVPPTKLHHFVVYLNNRSELRSIAIGAGIGGVLGAALAGGAVNREGDTAHTLVNADAFAALSGDNEYKRAFYEPAELKPGTSAYVIFIESETAGARRFTRTVAPISQKAEENRVPLHRALESAIHFHLNQ